ncbi:Ldh family oxidoreductase [Castellaniella sp. S9]|uniref:Ldh family oxidoreductase n=1 Tax=Castellaniella sp. S9 TaxID=2993652 RepID=UPI0022B42951|nr:Ldh family oxidoreductase [Castellaniella sp. S9]
MPTVDEITRKSLAALRAAGVPEPAARTQLSLLLEAELRGVPSHGLLRLPRVIQRIRNGVCKPNATGRGLWRREAFYEVDGENGLGPVVALSALEHVCVRAADTGVAVAAIRNCDHLGMLAWYAEQVARKGQILVALTISEALVHPWGGRRAMLGTNPITIGIPAQPDPFVFDMATSLVSMGKIHDHANRGVAIPEGWALNSEGYPTTDAAAAKQGAIAPFGGAKGYGLALGFELLVAALSGSAIGREVAGTLDSEQPCNKGDVFIVLEPTTGAAGMVSTFMQELRASPAADPRQPVRIPGDRARQARRDHLEVGIDLAPEVWEQIVEMAG